ncbi:MAG: protein translocase subunit SecD [bacterium]|nr:protein translocase subunit SecD [bacterium]MDE0376755.1 protein translocase subunit SecD [bacterium]
MFRRWLAVVILAGLAWGGLVAIFALGWTPRLGLDLQGGTSVILEGPEGTDERVIETAVEVMRRRIEDFGSVQEPEISITGGTSILVQLPGVTDQERALNAVGRTGLLSFRPVLSISPYLGAGEQGEGFVFPDGVDPETGLTVEDDINADRSFLPEYDDLGNIAAVYEVGPADIAAHRQGICNHGLDCSRLPTVPSLLTGAEVASALALFGQYADSAWTVQLNMTGEGAGRFAAVTGLLAQYPMGTPNRRLAIVLDGAVVSAPEISAGVGPDGISGGTAVITLGASEDQQEEAEDLTTVLRYGSLPVAFERSAVQKVSATLGEDSLRAGLIAGVGALVLVVFFLMVYYRSLGLVTLLGLTVFGSLLIVIFGVLGAWQGLTLTLSGVAGVIVSIGITTDSYIVLFERTKEEIRNGRTVVDANREAYRRAFRTILTADFVSFVGAVLLWALAIGPVKGFAQALGIATVLDVIVFVVFTRNASAIMARSRLGDGGFFSIRGTTGQQLPQGASR